MSYKYKYSISIKDFKDSYNFEHDMEPNDLWLDSIVVDCAQDYHDNHDGWDSRWPLIIYLFTFNGDFLGKFKVEKESQPCFYASKQI